MMTVHSSILCMNMPLMVPSPASFLMTAIKHARLQVFDCPSCSNSREEQFTSFTRVDASVCKFAIATSQVRTFFLADDFTRWLIGCGLVMFVDVASNRENANVVRLLKEHMDR